MKLNELESKLKPLKESVSSTLELPEPAGRLDMSTRGNDKTRQFKYLHQMCLMHFENYAIANKIKAVALVDGYIDNAKNKSSLGVYLFSRSLLELAAFSNDICTRLQEIYRKPDGNWRPKGEQFFGVLMRARFGTSNPDFKKILSDEGVSRKHLEPFNVMHSLTKLMSSKIGRGLKGDYDILCDYVHHNLSSHYTSSSGSRVGNSAHASGGGAIFTKGSGPIARYEYPVPSKAEKALADTVEIAAKSLQIFVQSINATPFTPYSEAQIKKVTGSKLGVTRIA